MLVVQDIDPLLGKTFGGRYMIETLIGEGGLGRVYRARHVKLSRRYAVKVPFGDVAGDDRLRHRFAQEAEAASRIEHANLVGVLDVGETEDGLLYLVMDFVDGDRLARLIAGGPMAPAQVADLVGQIAAGLGHAHDRGLVHRDLKPDNVLVVAGEHGPVARIVDFGIAIFRDDDTSRVTTQGIVMGTPHYMAPEQATGDKLDARTDLFALGVILYEMLAGVLPFEGAAIDIARQHLAAIPPAIADRVPGLESDPLLEALAFWMMAKRPAERPIDAMTVVELLRLMARDRDAARRQLGLPAASTPPSAAAALASGRMEPAASMGAASFESLPTLRDVSTARLRTSSRGPLVALITALAVIAIVIGVIASRRHVDEATATSRPVAAGPTTPIVDDHGSPPVIDPVLEPPGPGSSTSLAPPEAQVGGPPIGSVAGSQRAKPGAGERRPSRSDHRVVPPAGPDRPGSAAGSALPTPPPPPSAEVDAASLKRLYAAVGERINRAFGAADPRAAELRSRYAALPFLQALRTHSSQPCQRPAATDLAVPAPRRQAPRHQQDHAGDQQQRRQALALARAQRPIILDRQQAVAAEADPEHALDGDDGVGDRQRPRARTRRPRRAGRRAGPAWRRGPERVVTAAAGRERRRQRGDGGDPGHERAEGDHRGSASPYPVPGAAGARERQRDGRQVSAWPVRFARSWGCSAPRKRRPCRSIHSTTPPGCRRPVT